LLQVALAVARRDSRVLWQKPETDGRQYSYYSYDDKQLDERKPCAVRFIFMVFSCR
jgi:hypothetical protein